MLNKQGGEFYFLQQKILIYFSGHGLIRVQAQPGFQVQPGLRQVQLQILHKYVLIKVFNFFAWKPLYMVNLTSKMHFLG